MTLVSERNTAEVHLVENENERSGVSIEDFSAQQEWRLHPVVNIWTKVNTKKVNRTVMRHPGFSVAAKASRRPQFFIWNIITVMVSYLTDNRLRTVLRGTFMRVFALKYNIA